MLNTLAERVLREKNAFRVLWGSTYAFVVVIVQPHLFVRRNLKMSNAPPEGRLQAFRVVFTVTGQHYTKVDMLEPMAQVILSHIKAFEPFAPVKIIRSKKSAFMFQNDKIRLSLQKFQTQHYPRQLLILVAVFLLQVARTHVFSSKHKQMWRSEMLTKRECNQTIEAQL